ncbi:MAG: hypothetical protein ABH840_04185 [Nanoarchaeota archaeon]
MKIGIDVDDVLTETFKKFLKVYNERYSKNFEFENLSSFYLWDVLDISKEEAFNLVDEIMEEELEVVEGAVEGVVGLKETHEVFIITSRPERHIKITEDFIKKYFGDLKIFYSKGVHGGEKTKAEICKELGIDFFVEDCDMYALDCAEKGIKVLLLDKPWNKSAVESNNLIRVKNWGEVMGKLK